MRRPKSITRRLHTDCIGKKDKRKEYIKNVRLGKLKSGITPEEMILLDAIEIPKTPSEFEIQSYIYNEIKKLGYNVYGEVKSISGKHRFDLVIFYKTFPLIIVEVKTKAATKNSKSIKRQCEAYLAYGTHVELICGMNEAKSFISRFKYKFDIVLEKYLEAQQDEEHKKELDELRQRLLDEVNEYHLQMHIAKKMEKANNTWFSEEEIKQKN